MFFAKNKRSRRGDLANALSFVAMFGDLLLIFAGFLVAYWIRFGSGWISMARFGDTPPTLAAYSKLIFFGVVIVFLGLPGKNLYGIRSLLYPGKILLKLVAILGLCVFVFAGITMAVRTDPPISRLFVIFSLALIFLGTLAWRLLLGFLIKTPYCLSRLRSRLVVIGTWGDALRVQAGIADQDDLMFIGWVQIEGKSKKMEGMLELRLGQLHELDTLLRLHAVDIVVLTQTTVLSNDAIAAIMKTCENEHVQFKMVPQYFEILVSGLRPSEIGGLPVLGMESLPLDKQSNRIKKRLTDIAGALFGLTLFSPVILIFTAVVYFESPGPVFYRQVRTGQTGRLFKIIKIRSMRLDAEAGGAQWAQENDPRRLRVGAFMRKWNIDEIPQFWNVLMGEMSLVGPRPERPKLIAGFKHKIPHYNTRHMYPPGITGWAQVNGWRGNTSLEERIRHDIWYMEHWSLLLDIRIMVQTFYKRKNAY